jgi:hypothetical protein
VEPAVVPPFDPARGGVLDVGEGLVRPGWKTVVRMYSVLYGPLKDEARKLGRFKEPCLCRGCGSWCEVESTDGLQEVDESGGVVVGAGSGHVRWLAVVL